MRKEVKSEAAVAVGPYSHGIIAGDYVFLSGQTPLNAKTKKLMDNSIEEQTKQCFLNLEQVLKSAQLTFADVVKVNVFLTDMNNFEAMNSVYAKMFSEPFPARTTIGVAALPLGAEVEIELIAFKKK